MLSSVKNGWLLIMVSMLAVDLVHAGNNTCQLPNQTSLAESYNTFQKQKWKMADDAECLNQKIDLPTDYFMLSLSYAPNFCKTKGNDQKNVFECKSGNNFNWVTHGLWAEANHPTQCTSNPSMLQHPRYCLGDDYPVISADEVSKNLCAQPGFDLVEMEWAKHGTCSSLTGEAYLQKTRELYAQLELPKQDMQPPQIYKWLRKNNPALRHINMAFDNKAHELRICFDKQFAYIDCPR
jgi:ribonuclease T2